MAWSPNGKLIASAGYDGIVQLWDATHGNIVYTYRGHSPAQVGTMAWSPNGQFIASGGSDETVRVWKAPT
ncbi:MAG: hypothetical protein JOZ71_05510 [Ktedonobacteraceae bacterium]|nr:hypothetical protein [Ktedonobacteraceae bacterium]